MSSKLTDEEREWKRLAIARYRTFPMGLTLCVGRHHLSNEQAIIEIQRETEIGKLLVRVERFYLQNIKYENFKEIENGKGRDND